MTEQPWWQRGIIYQIYPRSFADTNADGIGDIYGITTHLDYLTDLGIDAIWLSPVYPSPMADFGYDITDYCAVDPLFGTLRDLEELIAAAHRRNIKLILDFVPNHTSNQHPWFIAARAARDNAKREWYLWRDPAADGGPPNNWLSHFGGSAWEFDASSGQYYLHSFLREQPDLNWRNPAVRAAMYDVLRFWLERGVDGFRVDVLWLLVKDDAFRDNPIDPRYRAGQASHGSLLPLYTADRPEVHAIIVEMRRVVEAYRDRVLIGEIYLPLERLVTYYGQNLGGAHLPFNFALIDAAWNAPSLCAIVTEYEAALPPGAWPNWVLGNHDKSRIASRVGSAQARLAAMLLLTLRGTPTIYYGDELGLCDVPIAPESVRDPAEKNEPGLGLGRDPQRTPLPWDASERGGFTTGEPWLPLGEHAHSNVATLAADPTSMLTLYRRLIELRRGHLALTAGSLGGVGVTDDVLHYERVSGTQRIAVILNLAPEPRTAIAPRARILLSSYLDRDAECTQGPVGLRAAEGLVLQL